MDRWYRHSRFANAYRLRGFLASGLGLAGAILLLRAERGTAFWSLIPLGMGLGLRIWARSYIGRHTRGQELQAPYRAVGGPYRWIGHPLYLANTLVALGCLGTVGAPLLATLVATIPVAGLYAVLGCGESAFLREMRPPSVAAAEAAPAWQKEIWSLLPPIALWLVLHLVR